MDIRVRPRSKKFAVHLESGEIIVYCREQPENGKANRELVRELSKLFDCTVRIVSGLTSRNKTVELLELDVEKAEKALVRALEG